MPVSTTKLSPSISSNISTPNNIAGVPRIEATATSAGVSKGGNTATYNSSYMDDGNWSNNFVKNMEESETSVDYVRKNGSELFNYIKRSNGIYQRDDIDIFNRRYRFGLFNPYETLSSTREFLFFTKPDLNIYARENSSGALTGTLNPALASIPYWDDLNIRYYDIINCLQLSIDKQNPFNHLLANMCISNLSVPGLDAETIETPVNMYGVGFSYRGSSEASNDSFEFDLEFKDTRHLPIYQFFKAYEEYETLKHHGIIGPWRGYIQDKVLHDQFAIYKFLVAEDMETIIYYAKFYGVIPKSLPRDVFSSSTFDSGISYSINFKAAFFEDMNPLILNDFNNISKAYYDSLPFQIDVYNEILGRMDSRPTMAAYIVSDYSKYAPGRKVYKLKWKGRDNY